ncbi:HBR108Cp [Eremothecium sinecaudum]|uniref:HBR108Cp n=1 Tax=Eremothecium sinecaudum TaxID=45286 RepID=A0A120K144_9SACH|nr:HBR108Cp [Eremothecium sinecaudum]AMD19009.1 HBR108Cp [Eremothecium sinecaudum]
MTIQSITGTTCGDDGINSGSGKVYQNYLMPTLKLYDAKVSINHWQLRDCVKYSSTTPGSVYYIYDHSVRSLDTRSTQREIQNEKLERRKRRTSMTNQTPRCELLKDYHSPSELVVQFDYKPRCFRENGGLIACGGLIGSDDSGSNLNGFSLHSEEGDEDNLTSVRGSERPSAVRTAPNVEPMKLANSSILTDNSFYGNQLSWKGIVALYNIENDVSLTYKLGQYINNCVELYQRNSQQYDLYTCNNDCHMYQCDVSNRGVELTRRFSDLKFALNSTAISHDGKTMVVSGDSSKFAIYHQNQLNGSFSLQYDTAPDWGSKWAKTKRVPRYAIMDRSEYVDRIYDSPGGDNGFCTSYSENDLQMATLFQNGLCLVYDMRKMDTPLAEISSTRRHSQNGSFRVCKFSQSFDDLLFISEHQSHVHVVDTRNLMNHQVIVIPDKIKNNEEVEILNTNSSSARRTSPSTSDPCVTYATKIPIRSLEPEVLPYPKVALYSTLHQNGFSDDPSSTPFGADMTQRRRRHSTFRVRRYSTSTRGPPNNEGIVDGIDPTILDHHYTDQNYRAVDNYNYVINVSPSDETRNSESTVDDLSRTARNTMPMEDMVDDETLEENQGVADDESDSMNSIDVYNDGPEVGQGGQFLFSNLHSSRPRHEGMSMTMTSVLNGNRRDSSSRLGRAPPFITTTADYFEENSISGIDWIQDAEGSSLVIGTDYGIIKWNINSWARRSFPCYDFC